MNIEAVVRQLALRPRSPSGVMLASIDCPQGDQAERIAAIAPAAHPKPNNALTADHSPPGRPAGYKL